MSKDDSLGMNWPRQQPAGVEILHSNERPNLTAVFGTTPPRGLSGMIRRQTFKRSAKAADFCLAEDSW